MIFSKIFGFYHDPGEKGEVETRGSKFDDLQHIFPGSKPPPLYYFRLISLVVYDLPLACRNTGLQLGIAPR